jgi:hypothetical protein
MWRNSNPRVVRKLLNGTATLEKLESFLNVTYKFNSQSNNSTARNLPRRDGSISRDSCVNVPSVITYMVHTMFWLWV